MSGVLMEPIKDIGIRSFGWNLSIIWNSEVLDTENQLWTLFSKVLDAKDLLQTLNFKGAKILVGIFGRIGIGWKDLCIGWKDLWAEWSMATWVLPEWNFKDPQLLGWDLDRTSKVYAEFQRVAGTFSFSVNSMIEF
ncbi:hypothetical protein RhiirC2_799128 [Rhizophagus irregularis]|uniref:Uncharacterized protein n=1 Tax=Rhizophagus irregularis TaxID=588596 RepID=A0A2N1M5E5_9GLOM|nr:hypothetical protein RhiirC2_799128 [Rhizophagus irregularis]